MKFCVAHTTHVSMWQFTQYFFFIIKRTRAISHSYKHDDDGNNNNDEESTRPSEKIIIIFFFLYCINVFGSANADWRCMSRRHMCICIAQKKNLWDDKTSTLNVIFKLIALFPCIFTLLSHFASRIYTCGFNSHIHNSGAFIFYLIRHLEIAGSSHFEK